MRRSRESWKTLRNLLGFIAIYITLYFGAATARGEGKLPAKTGSSTFQFILGPVTLNLSPNLVGPLGSVSTGRGAYLSIHLLLPDFEPETAANKNEFEKPSLGRKLLIFLEYPANIKTPHDALYGIHGWISKDDPIFPFAEVSSDVIGFRKYKNTVGTLIYVAENSDYYVLCLEVDLHPASCSNVRTVFQTVSLRYTFSRDYLPIALSIDKRLRGFLESPVQR